MHDVALKRQLTTHRQRATVETVSNRRLIVFATQSLSQSHLITTINDTARSEPLQPHRHARRKQVEARHSDSLAT